MGSNYNASASITDQHQGLENNSHIGYNQYQNIHGHMIQPLRNNSNNNYNNNSYSFELKSENDY